MLMFTLQSSPWWPKSIVILPNAGPDVKYFLGFIRTQLSTSTTILLIFGAKFYRLLKGEGTLELLSERLYNRSD